ncbi:hypothetical protein D3C84_1114580 [compost metagenome]
MPLLARVPLLPANWVAWMSKVPLPACSTLPLLLSRRLAPSFRLLPLEAIRPPLLSSVAVALIDASAVPVCTSSPPTLTTSRAPNCRLPAVTLAPLVRRVLAALAASTWVAST